MPAAIVLAAAAVTITLANGRFAWWPAAWLAPALVLLFLDAQPRKRALALVFAVQLVAFVVQWRGMIPVPGAWYYVVAGTYALAYFVPYVLHVGIASRWPAFASTLVLPSAWVTIEAAFQRWLTPYGSWGSIAYSQVDVTPVVQLAAVFGTSGVTFVLVWTAAVVAWVVRNRARVASIRRGVAIWAIAFAVVLAGGAARLVSAPGNTENTVRLAGLTPSSRLSRDLAEAMAGSSPERDASGSPATDAVLERADRLNAELLERTVRAVDAGARLVAWSEHAARVLPETEPALVHDAARIAADRQSVVVLGIGRWDANADPPFENKLIGIRPDGSTAWTYHKARPIAGQESGRIHAGDAEVATIDTAFGRVGVAICHDLDFPWFVRTAGRRDVDLLIAPSSDWSDIAVLHHRMAVLRAVENGFTLFRPCANGISSVVDPFGRTLEARRESGDAGLDFVVDVALHDVATPYPALGDAFVMANGVVVIALVLTGWRARTRGSRRRP